MPTRRHQLTEIALPDGCRVPYGGGLRRAQQVSSHPRADTAVTLDECDAAPAARGVQTRGDHRLRRARRRGGRYYLLSSGGRRRPGVQSRRRAPDDKYSPHSQTRLLTRPAVLWCVAWDASAAEMSRPARTLRLRWAIIWPREGGGGSVGAAASSRWQMLASQSKMAAHTPSRALVRRLGRVCCPCLS